MATDVRATVDVKGRVARLREELRRLQLGAFLATSTANVLYLAGIPITAYERFVGLLIHAEIGAVFVVPSLEAERAAYNELGADVRAWHDGGNPLMVLAAAADDLGVSNSRVGVEEDVISLGRVEAIRVLLPGADLVHASAIPAELRLRKEPDEIALLRESAAILVKGVEKVFAQIRQGMTELEVQSQVLFELAVAGSEGHSAVVLGGPNTALPHGCPGTRALQRGDLLTIDATAARGGYIADITRCGTIGPASEEILRWWSVLQEAQSAGIAAIGPGIRAGDVDRAARGVIERRGFGDAFVHRTGHGLGLEVHEAPYLYGDNNRPLDAGMVVTVEPGLYFPGRGGVRLEDDVTVGEDGAQLLTNMPRDLRTLGVD